MRYSLPLILVLLLQTFPCMVVAGGNSQDSMPNPCQGMIQEATKVARQLFRQNRPPDTLRDYKISFKTKEKEIAVNFTRKSSPRLGDHPFVIYDCEKKTGQYFEGE